MKNKKGNIAIIAMIFTSGVLIIMMFVLAIFRSNVNGLLYGVKTDMYVANKAAVVSVNKNQANIDNFKYDEKEYKKYLKKALMKNYNLNDNLENPNALIKKIEIIDYKIYQKGELDSYTSEKCDNATIHTILKIEVKPIIMAETLEDVFTFTIHEDVNLNMARFDR